MEPGEGGGVWSGEGGGRGEERREGGCRPGREKGEACLFGPVG